MSHIKASEYEPGDRVVLVQTYSFRGRPTGTKATKMPLGAHGTVQEKDIQDPQHIASDIVAIDWGVWGSWFTDAVCFEPVDKPLSEEELAEVYKILGVDQ